MKDSPPDWSAPLQALLLHHSEGISEYQLIKELKAIQLVEPDYNLNDSLKLFRLHFVLFNQLYQLRDELRHSREYELEIHTLKIQLMPYATGHQALAAEDKLRQYYLDWDEFLTTNRQDVDDLLDGFWDRYKKEASATEVKRALAILKLDEDADETDIKKRYRQLMHQHHPDKGGEVAQCQTLTWAYQILIY